MPSDGPAVRAIDLRCQYGDFVVMDDITFDVERGEVFVILGGSGCGKSTLLKNLVGLVPVGAGDVQILGESLVAAEGDGRDAILRSFGMMFQGGALFSSMTLAQNVALPLREFTDLPEVAIAQLVKMKLELVNLGGYESFYPSEISGGMLKRAAVARALALDPKLLFFDEPSAGLDPSTGAELDELILGLRDTLGTTMVIVTHELSSIYAVADRCIVLDKARKTIVATGNPADLRDNSEDPYVQAFFRRLPLRESA